MTNILLENSSKNPIFYNPESTETDIKPTFENIFGKYEVKEYSSKVQLEEIIYEHCSEKENTKKSSELEAFYLINLAKVIKAYEVFVENLPRVRPYYAVKCNSDTAILRLLNELGAGFDCASQKEMELLESFNLDYSKDVIFANPCKMVSHIEYAEKIGVEFTTLDNVLELQKISKHWNNCKVVVRIAVDDSNSHCQFSSKFGASYSECEKIFEMAKELKINIVGISFHVGSGCFSVESFLNAIKKAKSTFELAKKFDFDLKLLDIGGGFPGSTTSKPSFLDMAKEINPLIDELFAKDVTVIAEPGRYFASECHTLVCNIFGKREVFSKKQLELNEIKQEFLYYANDGIYNSFSCLFFDNVEIEIKPFSTKKNFNEVEEKFKSKIFGPTCDALDVICSNTLLPRMEIGDWFYVTEFGAYTRSSSTKFNGFSVDKSYYYYQ